MSADHDRALRMFRALCPESNSVHVLVVEGNPPSKARVRFTRRGGGTAYPSKKQKQAESALGWRFKSVFREKLHGTLAVGCVFFRKTRQRIDVDNMLKHVMDAANGIAWADDSQVTAQMGVIELDPERPRTVIVIGEHESSMKRANDHPEYCKNCGKAFKKSMTSTRFCSRSCGAAATRGARLAAATCPTCRNSFRRKTARQKYCSNPCKHAARSGAGPKNDPPVCQSCGMKVSRREYQRCRDCFLRRDLDAARPRVELTVESTA